MDNASSKASLVLAGLIISLSLVALAINYYWFQFPGGNFFPDHSIYIGFTLALIYLGFVLLTKPNTYPQLVTKEILYFYLMMAVIALASNAVQFTPFTPIDKTIIDWENRLGIDLLALMQWTDNHVRIKGLFIYAYNSLPLQMSVIPLALIFLKRFETLRSYYFLMLFSTFIGFSFYYFYPTTAPASMFDSPLFATDQIATGIKFKEIHAHVVPSTKEGGLIAMPSFHTIWALFCVYLLKEWRILGFALGVFNAILIASCIMLGWHFPADVVAGLVLAALAYFCLRLINHPHPSTHAYKIV